MMMKMAWVSLIAVAFARQSDPPLASGYREYLLLKNPLSLAIMPTTPGIEDDGDSALPKIIASLNASKQAEPDAIEVSRDGRALMASYSDGEIVLWRLSGDRWQDRRFLDVESPHLASSRFLYSFAPNGSIARIIDLDHPAEPIEPNGVYRFLYINDQADLWIGQGDGVIISGRLTDNKLQVDAVISQAPDETLYRGGVIWLHDGSSAIVHSYVPDHTEQRRRMAPKWTMVAFDSGLIQEVIGLAPRSRATWEESDLVLAQNVNRGKFGQYAIYRVGKDASFRWISDRTGLKRSDELVHPSPSGRFVKVRSPGWGQIIPGGGPAYRVRASPYFSEGEELPSVLPREGRPWRWLIEPAGTK